MRRLANSNEKPSFETVGTKDERIAPQPEGCRHFHRAKSRKQFAFEAMCHQLGDRIDTVGAKIRLKAVQ